MGTNSTNPNLTLNIKYIPRITCPWEVKSGGGAKYLNYIKRDEQQSIVRTVLAF